MIGDRAVQSNYFITDLREHGCLAALADGTIDSVNGMRAAVLCCNTVRTGFSGGFISEDLFLACQKVLSQRIYLGRTPRISLTAVWMEEKQIFYRQTGSQRLYLSTLGTLVPILDREGALAADEKAGLVLCSRGVSSVLSEVEIGSVMAKNGLTAYERSQEMLQLVRGKRKKGQENATIVIVERG